MKKLNRRSFFKFTWASLLAFVMAKLSFQQKHPEEDPPLKEAEFYKKHHFSG